MQLTDFSVLSFDWYGTLIDWEAGLLQSLQALVSRAKRSLSRSEILAAYARHESQQELRTPTKIYSELMATVYKRMAEEWGANASWDECLEFGRSLRNWSPFPDSVESLAFLKQHYKLVILSNVDNASFAATNENLGVTFDAIYTAQDIGSYKPDDNNFRFMIESMTERGIDQSRILHTAQSLYHDHEPANRHELASCWIDRQHASEGEGLTPATARTRRCDFRFRTLSEMVEVHRTLA